MKSFIPDSRLFILQELIAPEIYRDLEKKNKLSIAWRLLNPRMLWTLVQMRKYFAQPIYINNWDSGGLLKYRGLRPFNCVEGVDYSGHKFGNCVDLTVKNHSAEEIREHIIVNQSIMDIYKYISALEDFAGMSWVHIGFDNIDNTKGIFIFKAA